MVIGSLCHLKKGVELSTEEERKALILGWCVELVQLVCTSCIKISVIFLVTSIFSGC